MVHINSVGQVPEGIKFILILFISSKTQLNKFTLSNLNIFEMEKALYAETEITPMVYGFADRSDLENEITKLSTNDLNWRNFLVFQIGTQILPPLS